MDWQVHLLHASLHEAASDPRSPDDVPEPTRWRTPADPRTEPAYDRDAWRKAEAEDGTFSRVNVVKVMLFQKKNSKQNKSYNNNIM